MASSSYSNEIDDIEMSCKGMQFLLNNDLDACQQLFDQYRHYSPLMNGAWSFVSFLRAVISFDDQRLSQAAKDLAESEKLCGHETLTKFSRPLNPLHPKTMSHEEHFIRRIVIADCKLYQAILTIIKQELSGLIGAGFLLRKAWKIYEKLHNELLDLYRSKDPNAEKEYGSKFEETSNYQNQSSNTTTNTVVENNEDDNDDDDDDDLSFKSFASDPTEDSNELSLTTIKRLLGSVSFGYGLFQIALSFVPPRIMKLIKFLGFEGDRKVALAALRFSSQSSDMKAPLANLTLLWYHCIIQPFFAIDISNPPDMSEAKGILKRNLEKYSRSTLFIYFQGRLERIEKNLSKALETFLSGLTPIKSNELEQILVYDIGFCYMMMWNFETALTYFERLREESRWSKSFYCYISAVCTASMGDENRSNNLVKEGIKLLQKRTNPVELFVQKRLEYLKKNPASKSTANILIMEMLYLWIMLPSCEVSVLGKMLQIIDDYGRNSKDDVKLRPIVCLIEGAIHNILLHSDDARNCYEEAIARTEDSKLNLTRYVPPFASCELGILEYLSQQNVDYGKELLTRAKEKYNDFDFDNRLQIRATATLRLISMREASAANSK